MMTIMILIVLVIGTYCGYFLVPDSTSFKINIELAIKIMLNIMILSVGIGIGLNKSVFNKIIKEGLKICLIPLGTIIGSFIGGIITGLILNIGIKTSLAISSGFGWYTLSAGLLKNQLGDEIGAIALLANVFREILAIILIPILAKKLNPYTSISVAGATSMDTTLPLISKSSSEEYVIVSFIHGFILTTLVPILIPLFTL